MSLLHRALLGNGLFSTVTGALAALLAVGLADYMAVSTALLSVIGVGTAAFGLLILMEVRRERVREGFALFVIAADATWALGALAVLAIPGSMENKWLLAAVSAVVALFAIVQSRGLIAATRDNPRRLVTEVNIAASPQVVWAHLTDLESFSGWNPFMIEAEGQVADGSKLRVRMQPPGGRAMTFAPTVTRAEDSARFQWLGHLAVPGIFDGRHDFRLEPCEGGTLLTHSEEFTGLLVPALWKSLDGGTRAGFEAMNTALRVRAEVGEGG